MVLRKCAEAMLAIWVLVSLQFAIGNELAKCPSGARPLENSTTGAVILCDDVDAFCPVVDYQCILNEGTNGTAEGICCPKVFALEPRNEGCPAGTRLLRNSLGQLVICSSATVNTCPTPERTVCYNSMFGQICCIADGDYCPAGYQPYTYPGTLLPLVCGPTTMNRCPSGYRCLQSPTAGSPYTCCRLRQTPTGTQCPTGYQLWTDFNGSPRACIVGNPASCPSPTVCPATSNLFQSYCCLPVSTQQLQCPNGYALPSTGQITACVLEIGGFNRCPVGSSCKPSLGASGGVCCRSLARCPAGYREAVNAVTQEIVECTSSALQPQTCPIGSTCLLSSTTVSSLCCIQTAAVQCPMGYTLVQALVTPCQFDSHCPTGAQCIQSMCCMGSSAQDQCPSGYSAVLDANNKPVLCSSSDPRCPLTQASCLQSITAARMVCCVQSGQHWPQCPLGMSITLFAGQPIPCTDTPNACPPGSTCQTSTIVSTLSRICCQTTVATQPQCPRGLTVVIGHDNQPMFCNPAACPATTSCERAINIAREVCCKDITGPVGGKRCPTGYNVQNSGGQAVICNPTAIDACINFGFCLPAVTNAGESTTESICCEPNGIQCPPGYNRPEATFSSTTCDPAALNPCASINIAGVTCIGAVGTGVTTQRPFMCCQRSPLCMNSRIPYYDQSYQPKSCVINRPNECSTTYRCEISSTVEGKSICCPRPMMATSDDGHRSADGKKRILENSTWIV